MATSPAEILYGLLVPLEESGSDWSYVVSFMPDDPDVAVALYDTAGRLDGRIMATGENIDHPGVQIMVRALSHVKAFNKANDLALFLSTVIKSIVTISPEEVYIVHNISRTGSIIPLGVDAQGNRRRHSFSINAVLTLSKKN